MRLRLDELSVEAGGTALVRRLSLDVGSGEVVGLIGPNGSGKSTALRCVYRALRPSGGTVWVGSAELNRLSLGQAARSLAAVPQGGGSELDFTVAEVVALGRSPHVRGNRRCDDQEKSVCRAAMARLDVLHLADRGVLTLSGGELQRVLVARAVAQQTPILVLDEPTNHLDVRHQIELLGLLKGSGRTVLLVLHDLNLAAATCDRLGVLSDGRLVAAGAPEAILTPDLVREVFGVSATPVRHPTTGAVQLLYTLPAVAGPDDGKDHKGES